MDLGYRKHTGVVVDIWLIATVSWYVWKTDGSSPVIVFDFVLMRARYNLMHFLSRFNHCLEILKVVSVLPGLVRMVLNARKLTKKEVELVFKLLLDVGGYFI